MDKRIALLAGAGILYYLSKNTGQPTFYDMQGTPITGALCGSSATFDVPGHKQVWMDQLKDGVLNFSGPFNLPMPAYIFSCSKDVGAYDIAVYAIGPNGEKGELIGSTSFTVHPQ